MGAQIECLGSNALIRGIYPLKGAHVTASDLRGGAALVVAALAAQGETVIGQCSHIRRGYEDISRDLKAQMCIRDSLYDAASAVSTDSRSYLSGGGAVRYYPGDVL